MPEPINESRINSDSWTDEVETFLLNIKERSTKHSENHINSGYHKKKLNIIFTIPPIIIPAFMTPIAAEFSEENWLQVLSPIVFAFVAVASALATYFSYAKKSEQHFQYAANYNDLVTDIEEQLCRPADKRRDANTFMTSIMTKFDSFGMHAPIL